MPGPDGAEEFRKAAAYALRALNRRDLSEGELRDRLSRRGVPGPVIERVIGLCREYGYLDDARLAQGLVRSRSGRRGRFAVQRELRRRGVSAAAAGAALSGLTPDREREAARELLLERLPRLAGPGARRKAFGLLVRRGYGTEIAAELVAELVAEDQPSRKEPDAGSRG